MERPQPKTELELDQFLGGVVAALVLQAGGEVRLRFRDLGRARLHITHDSEADELILRASEIYAERERLSETERR